MTLNTASIKPSSLKMMFALIRADATALLDRIELIPLEIDLKDSQNSWIKYAGMFKDDPDFAEIAAAIRAERDSDDETEVDPSVYMR